MTTELKALGVPQSQGSLDAAPCSPLGSSPPNRPPHAESLPTWGLAARPTATVSTWFLRHWGRQVLSVAVGLLAVLLFVRFFVRARDESRIVALGTSEVAFTSEAIVPGKAELTNSLGMKLVWIPPGRFCLGSADLADDIQGDEKPHRVCITRPFYLAVHEVTVGQFRRFVEATGYSTDAERSERYKGLLAMPPDLFNEKSRLAWYDPPFPQAETSPVVYVSWSDAQAFVAWLGSLEGRDYRLPSEAEWEYACRAGSTTRFSTGDDEETLRRSANVRDGGAWRPRGLPRDGFRFASPVGSFPANSFGLCDMHGNVWEWCADWYRADYYHESLPADPPGPAKGSERVLRGGSYFLSPDSSRSANRASNPPDFYSYEVGFRVALTPD